MNKTEIHSYLFYKMPVTLFLIIFAIKFNFKMFI